MLLLQFRTRSVQTPAQFGGAACSVELTEDRPCYPSAECKLPSIDCKENFKCDNGMQWDHHTIKELYTIREEAKHRFKLAVFFSWGKSDQFIAFTGGIMNRFYKIGLRENYKVMTKMGRGGYFYWKVNWSVAAWRGRTLLIQINFPS